MKRLLVSSLLSLTILGLAACASSMDRGAYAYETSERRIGDERIEPDAVYINAVNRTARRRGVQVEWVNPPIRRVPNQ